MNPNVKSRAHPEAGIFDLVKKQWRDQSGLSTVCPDAHMSGGELFSHPGRVCEQNPYALSFLPSYHTLMNAIMQIWLKIIQVPVSIEIHLIVFLPETIFLRGKAAD